MPTSVQLAVCPTPKQIVDYSNGNQLTGVGDCVDGVVQYAVHWPGYTAPPVGSGISAGTKAALDAHIEAATPTTPDGGFLLFDAEPWTQNTEIADYPDNDQETNLFLFAAYAETWFQYGPTLRYRQVTMHSYKAPIDVNFVGMSSTTSGVRRAWANNQRKLLWQAKHAGMLDAFKAANTGVAIPLYPPSTWNVESRIDDLQRVIDNADAVLADFDIDYVYLMEPVINGVAMIDGLIDVFLEKAWWRLAAWGGGTSLGFPQLISRINAANLPGTVPCASVDVPTSAELTSEITSAIESLVVPSLEDVQGLIDTTISTGEYQSATQVETTVQTAIDALDTELTAAIEAVEVDVQTDEEVIALFHQQIATLFPRGTTTNTFNFPTSLPEGVE